MAQPSFTKQAQDVINATSTDIRSVLGTSGNDATILMGFVSRTQLDIMRSVNWTFSESAVQRFITAYGQTDYWIGATGTNPAGTIDTGLNLSDVETIKEGSVYDRSNYRQLNPLQDQPLADSSLANRDGTSVLDQPRLYVQNPDNAYIIHLYPAPDNRNIYQPVPPPPAFTVAAGGALAARVYWVQTTYVDSLGNEGTPSRATKVYVPASSLLTVVSPVPEIATGPTGIKYGQYKVYAIAGTSSQSTDPGSECVQNGGAAINTGTNWTEQNTGLATGTALAPTSSTLEYMDGYQIEFRYWKSRAQITALNQTLQIPDEYFDVVVAGTNWLACQFLKKGDEAQMWMQVYQNGLRSMLRDKNKPPKVDFIRPILP